MRAIWMDKISNEKDHVLREEAHHHLVNVLRVSVEDELLLLDGAGLVIKCRIVSISKKEVKCIELDREVQKRKFEIDLALGVPKREALELCLKEAVELGFRRIYLVRGDYSQQKVPELERMQKIIVSGLEQSNSPYLPEVLELSWHELPWNTYSQKLLMDSQTKVGALPGKDQKGPSLLIVGPEGGFSPSELVFLHAQAGIEILNLPTPILRSPTAVAAGAGCLLQRLIDRK